MATGLLPGKCASSLRSRGMLYGTAWKKEATEALVTRALLAGFRGVDTACQPKHYREDLVGRGIAAAAKGGRVEREGIWIQTKFTSVDGQDLRDPLPYDPDAPVEEQVRASVQRSRTNLGVEIIDSLVLHSPVRGGMGMNRRVWGAMERAVDEGFVGQLGVSNCYDLKIFERYFWGEVTHRPKILQNRFYADSGYDRELRHFCAQNDVLYQSFWTLTANPDLLASKLFAEVARKYDFVGPEQVMYKYLLDTGHQPLSGTCSQQHMEEDVALMNLKTRLAREDLDEITHFIQLQSH